MFTTQIEYECDLDHLLTDSEEMNQTKSETEIEWILMQARPTCNEDCVPKVLNPGENELVNGFSFNWLIDFKDPFL